MGRFFEGRQSSDCKDNGGHDQRVHQRTNEATNEKTTVVDCGDCGTEWSYDSNGNRK